MARFINPFTDWGFKHIFGREISKDLLIAFLNDLFKDEFEITQLEFKNNEQIGITADSRSIIFDNIALRTKVNTSLWRCKTAHKRISLTAHSTIHHVQ